MARNGYLDLINQRNELLKPVYDGVKAAKLRLDSVNAQIAQTEKNPKIFEPTFVHTKPGYTKPMIQTLVAQARIGSITCQKDLVNYSNWLIDQMAVS